MRLLDEKVSIITGGTSGIGEAAVHEFVKEGASVVIADIDRAKGAKMKQELSYAGVDVLFVETDIKKEEHVINVVNETVEKFGNLDVLFNNAGIVNHALGHEMEFSEWRRAMSINIDGVFLMAKYSIEQMLKNGGGSIVNTAS